MKSFCFYAIKFFAITFIALAAGCSSMPNRNNMLEEARNDYAAAQNNQTVVSLAPAELKQAGDALAQADKAFNDHEKTDKIERLAYIAKQKAAISQEVAKQKMAEISSLNTIRERDQARLEQRTAEADRAKVAESAAQAHARQLEAQLAELSAKQTDRGVVITIGDVLFDTNTARLKSTGLPTVKKVADILKQNPERTILIEGFTDSTGSSSRNQILSERRAAAVFHALVNLGIGRHRMNTRGYGENYPVANNDTAANRGLNRRVEITLSTDGNKIAPR